MIVIAPSVDTITATIMSAENGAVAAPGAVIETLPSSSTSPSSKPVVAVDLDEVLGEFVPQLIQFHNNAYDTALQLSDFHSYEFHQVWGGTREQSVERVHRFFASDYFANIPTIDGSYETLSSLTDRYDFYVVTARQHSIEPQTKQWLERNFRGIFRGILHGNHYGVGSMRTKAEMCQLIDARILIDDSAHHAQSCSSVLDHVLLFDRCGQYNWNKGKEEFATMPGNVLRLHSWDEIRAFLEQYQPQPASAASRNNIS